MKKDKKIRKSEKKGDNKRKNFKLKHKSQRRSKIKIAHYKKISIIYIVSQRKSKTRKENEYENVRCYRRIYKRII